MASVQGYRLFNVVLARKQVLSPSMLCCVFSGDDVRQMKMDAPDQRIKLLFPSLNGTPSTLTDEGDKTWWETARAMPQDIRPIARTYTLRHVNADAGEVEVEFVMHGTEGPASAWALNAEPGAALQMVAPNRACPTSSGGYEWDPHPDVERALVVADETALPAAKAILEQLAGWSNPPQLQMFLEMPKRGDCVDLSHYTFADIHWLPREETGASHGEALLQAVQQRVMLPESALVRGELHEEKDGDILWDRADSGDKRFHGWVAAESSAVKQLRRYLIGERGLSPECISFMAYWSRGPRRND
ncbi:MULTISPECIES: siderophore-interacting protein [Erwinia]|uniref:Siderophore-interacting protein n=1 Tax=Erwinia rhapontici TaxID=55212 RepID=A0ABM7MUN5_ERWRD|nr:MULTISPECIES: siderophore-interacting protein [Erwinia]MBP2153582.1 NADPH-dependent ferric siderophore reductase [Erwinia rhapontici]MCS3608649.1 NADPH-dependent ferric siderophore reductase [Erwinia rhapontici]NKG31230.1 siderophore-interacting protein [Erwinia rhapontici]NNS08883.1 siderophore-interacting protein [Erwinia sp. JH02]BCQ32857.1 siderophore-interacting protein [Erwinia rhapontici]